MTVRSAGILLYRRGAGTYGTKVEVWIAHGNDGKGPEPAWLVAHLTRANAVFLMICPPVQDQHHAR